MNLCFINHNYKYELEKLVRLFLPFEKIYFFENLEISEFYAETVLREKTAYSKLVFYDKVFEKELELNFSENTDREEELKLALSLYDCLKRAFDYIPEWGILTGVRPAKLFSKFVKQMGYEEAVEYFKEYFKVSEKKISLCEESISGEDKITALSKPNSFSLYVSIPFCPSRCSYCSFVSHSVESAKKLIPDYIEKLCEEIEYTSKIAKQHNLKLETVYIGGGTPTSLSAEEIESVMMAIKNSFDLSGIREYTVEAGRPDTITREKLVAIKTLGATRISINPQTMNDDVLVEIGRRHTSNQTIESFRLAREVGFDNINMDLIAGLPTDTYESFKTTLEKVIELEPESVTVHSLSMKRSSRLTVKGEIPEIEIGKEASKMVDFAREVLSEKGINPYYMYRQSKTVGNLENVGYSKKGFECLYNVYIMDETHTILACGASAVTKLREPHGDYIERIFNYKYPYEYIGQFDEMLSRKDGIIEFYTKFPV